MSSVLSQIIKTWMAHLVKVVDFSLGFQCFWERIQCCPQLFWSDFKGKTLTDWRRVYPIFDLRANMGWHYFWRIIPKRMYLCFHCESPLLLIKLFDVTFIKIRALWNGILSLKLFWPTVRKNCSSEREKLLKFKAEGKIFEITATIYLNSERSEQVLVTECFLTCSWRFLIANRLEQL